MKTAIKKVIICSLVSLLLLGCSSNNEYIITGTFSDNPDEEWIYLVELASDEPRVDSARIENGTFVFKGTTEFPNVYGISYHWTRAPGIFPIFLEPADLNVVIDIYNWEGGSKISGGPVNEQYMEFLAYLEKEFLSGIRELREKRTSTDEDEWEKIEKRIDDLWQQVDLLDIDFIKSNPESPVSIFWLHRKFKEIHEDELSDILNNFSLDIKETSIYNSIEEYLSQLPLKGSSLSLVYTEEIEVTRIDLNDNAIISTLVELNPGIPLYIKIWGTWCGVCIERFPHMRMLNELFVAEDLVFVYICIESNEERWKVMILTENLKGQHYLLSRDLAERLYQEIGLEIMVAPTYLIVNSKGELIKNIPSPSEKIIIETLTQLIE